MIRLGLGDAVASEIVDDLISHTHYLMYVNYAFRSHFVIAGCNIRVLTSTVNGSLNAVEPTVEPSTASNSLERIRSSTTSGA